MPPLTAQFVAAVRDHLEDAGPSTASELAGRMDLPFGDVYSALRRLADDGYVCRERRDGRGLDQLFWVPVRVGLPVRSDGGDVA